MTRCLLAMLLLSLLLAEPLLGRDIHVDNVAGSDRHDGSPADAGGQRAGPCRTITRALQLSRPGDRIVLTKTGEPYRESITLQATPHSGVGERIFELVGNGAVLDGTQPVPKDAWQHVRDDVYRFHPSKTSFQMLYLGAKPAQRVPTVAGEGLPELRPLEWCLYERHIYFRADPNKLPRQYDLSCADLTVGITLYDVHHFVIRDLIVQGFQLDGVNAHDNVFAAELKGLICRGNGRSGISVGGASRVKIDECLVGDNGAAQVRTEGYSHAELVNCSLLKNTAPAVVRDGGQVSLLDGTRIE